MYARVSTTIVTDSNVDRPGVKLRGWADSLYYNPMYSTIRAQMADRPGFMYNSHSLVEYKNTAKLVSQVVFDTKENFDVYAADPQTTNLWELIESLSKESGVSIKFIDTDQFLHF
jgi:antibiotic biosynthesis monooxygenase (ABM) superfamily enzyme